MSEEQTVWVVEKSGDFWDIRGERAPGSSSVKSFGFAMEVAAEEAKRLGIDGVVEVRRNGRKWRTEMRHVIEDYGLGDRR